MPSEIPEPDFLKQVALSEALKLRAGINDAAQVITAARLFEGYLKETADVDL